MSSLAWLEELERNKGSTPLSSIAKKRTKSIEGIIIHHTEGAPSLDGNLTWARQQHAKGKGAVGADIYILPDGSYVRATKPGERMDHAGIKNISKFKNDNTLSIEVITTANGMPNAAQYKTAHGIATQIATENNFELSDRIHAHGEVSPSHKNKWEGLGIAHAIRTNGDYDEENRTVDYAALSRRYSRGRPVMRPEVHPIDLKKPWKNYDPHSVGTGEKHIGDLPLESPRATTPPTLKETIEKWNPPPTDPFAPPDTKLDTQPVVENPDGSVPGVNIEGPEGPLSTVSEVPVTNIIPQDRPAGDYGTNLTEEGDAFEAPTGESSFTGSVSTEDVVNQLDIGVTPLVPREDPIVPQDMMTSFRRQSGLTRTPEAIETDQRESEARRVESSVRLPIPEPITMPVIPSVQTINQANQTYAQAKAPELRSWLDMMEGDLTLRNTLWNSLEEMHTSWTSEVRNRVDPEFAVPTEELKKYPQVYHNYLLKANNSDDYVIREKEVQDRVLGEKIAQDIWDEGSGLKFWSAYLLAGTATMLPYIAVGTASGALATRALSTGASAMRWWGVHSAADAVAFSPEMYYGLQGDVFQPHDIPLMLAGSVAGGALSARFARSGKVAAEQIELSAQISLQTAKEKWRAAGSPLEAKPRVSDGLDEIYTPRPLIDEEGSLEVSRVPSQEAVVNFDRDQLDLKSWQTLTTSGNKIKPKLLKKIEEIFDRQAHTVDTNKSGFVKVPSGMDAESYIKSLVNGNKVLYLTRNANDVVGESGGSVVKITVPSGHPLIDMAGFADAKSGSFAMRPTILVPKTKGKRPRGTEALLKGPTPFATRNVKLKDANRNTVTKGGKPVEFSQTDVVLEGPKVVGARKQWVKMSADLEPRDPNFIQAVNDLKLSKGDKWDEAKPFEDLPDEWFEGNELGGRWGNLSAGASATDNTPAVRARVTNVTDDTTNYLKEQELFGKAKHKLPFWMSKNSIFYPLLSNAVRMADSSNFVARDIASKIMDTGFNPTRPELDAGKGVGRKLEHVHQRIQGEMDSLLMRARYVAIEKYIDSNIPDSKFPKLAKMKPHILQKKLVEQFEEEAADYQRQVHGGLKPRDPHHPGILEYAKALDFHYKTMLDYLQDPGKAIGRDGEFPPVEGFEDIVWSPGWSPRVYNGDIIRNTEVRTKDEWVLNKWLKDALKEAGGLMQNDKWREWAMSRVGIKKGVPATQKQLDDMGDMIDAKAKQIADTMADTIKNAKEGWSVDLELISGKGSAVRQVAFIKAALKNKLTPDVEEVLDAISREGVTTDRAGKVITQTDGKSGTHSFRRALLNENYILKTTTGPVTLKDFLNNNATAAARGYLRKTAGRVALGGFEYTSPGGGVNIKGISSDAEWDNRIVNPIMEMETAIGKHKTILGQDNMKNDLMAIHRHLTGTTEVGPEAFSMTNNYSYGAYLGNAGISQSQEFASLIGKYGVGPVLRSRHWKEVSESIASAAKKGDLRQLKDSQRILNQIGIGNDIIRGAFGAQADERMGQFAGEGLSSKTARLASHGLEKFARFTATTSGLAGGTQEMQKMSAHLFMDKSMEVVNKHASFSSMPRRFKQEFVKDYGDPIAAERVFNMLKKHGVWSDEDGLETLNRSADGFDRRAEFEFLDAIKRDAESLIQTGTMGASHRLIQQYPIVRVFMALKNFMTQAVYKQQARNFRNLFSTGAQAARDLKAGNMSAHDGFQDSMSAISEPIATLLLHMAAAAAAYQVTQEIRMLAMTSEEAEEHREKALSASSLIQAAVIRSGNTGMIPTIWNTPMQYAYPDATVGVAGYRGSGLDSSLLGVPAIDQLKKALKGGADIGVWALDSEVEFDGRQATRRLQQLLTNQQIIATGMNVTATQIFEEK